MNAPSSAFPMEITTIRKSARESISIRLCEFEGRPYVDIRTVDIASASKPQFTKKGCTVRPKLLGELIAALEQAERQAAALGLLADGGAR